MQAAEAGRPEVAALEEQAIHATRSGRVAEAERTWERLLALEPRHARALDVLGELSFRRGDLARARDLIGRLVEVDGKTVQQWINLAVVSQRLGDQVAEERAIAGALGVDPSDLLGLLMRGDLKERQGRRQEAARAYGAAATVAPPMDRLRPELRPSVSHAVGFKAQYDRDCAAFLDERLAPWLADMQGEDLRRFRDGLDMLVGRKRRYDSQSVVFHYPRLPAIEFFDRDETPWLDAVEAATDAVRQEFMAALRSEEGFTPYIEYPADVPHNQWKELNHSPRWSALHLFRMGERIEGNASRCPRTMEVLGLVPQPTLPGRTPSAMFSLLKPRTRIPAHTGVTNARVVAHLPLVIPPDCGFRVGNETREWAPGAAWVFDDTIEHEAWNESDALRVILIFDVWHPHLSPAERTLITAMFEGLNTFAGAGEFEL
jgi:aspartyl/asparaginyl beta-hydroxylase (cupin superfamily)